MEVYTRRNRLSLASTGIQDREGGHCIKWNPGDAHGSLMTDGVLAV